MPHGWAVGFKDLKSWQKFSWYTGFLYLEKTIILASLLLQHEKYISLNREGRSLDLRIQGYLLFKEKSLLSSKRSWDQKKKKRRRSEKQRENNIFLFFLMHYSPLREIFFFPLKIRFFFTLLGDRIGLWTLCAVKLCLELSFCTTEGSWQI